MHCKWIELTTTVIKQHICCMPLFHNKILAVHRFLRIHVDVRHRQSTNDRKIYSKLFRKFVDKMGFHNIQSIRLLATFKRFTSQEQEGKECLQFGMVARCNCNLYLLCGLCIKSNVTVSIHVCGNPSSAIHNYRVWLYAIYFRDFEQIQ